MQPRTLLDAGCGEGFNLKKIEAHLANTRLFGLDIELPALAYAKEQLGRTELLQGDVTRLPYPDNHFDLVLCNEVLEHLEHPEAALKEVIRVSSKHIILSVPREPFFSLGNLLSLNNIPRMGNPADHIQRWSSDGFARFISHYAAIKKIALPFPWVMIVAEIE